MKKIVAWALIVASGIPNTFLAAVCFYALMGSVSHFVGSGWNHTVMVWISSFLGIAMTLGEALTNIDAKDKGYTIKKYVMMILFVIINVFAGNYRVEDTQREARMDARQLAQNDPRWIELDKEQSSYDKMMNNGYAGDDVDATNGMEKVKQSRNAIVQEYVSDAHVQSGATNFMGFGSSWLANLLFVGVNLVFGLGVYLAYEGKDEEETAKPFNLPAFKFRFTPLKATGATTTSVTSAQGQTVEQIKKPQGIGFHASWRESDLPRQNHKDLPVGFTSPAPADREVETRIVYVDRIKDGEHTNTVINNKPDMKALNRKSRATAAAKKEANIEKAKALNSSGKKVSEIAKMMDKSETTIRSYLNT